MKYKVALTIVNYNTKDLLLYCLKKIYQAHISLPFQIIVLDNGAFHKAKTLEIPLNIGLIFLPPYSPELNPAEKIWANLKRKFTNKFCKTLDEVSEFITDSIKGLEKNVVKKTCNFEYIQLGSNWTI
jgi:transposase